MFVYAILRGKRQHKNEKCTTLTTELQFNLSMSFSQCLFMPHKPYKTLSEVFPRWYEMRASDWWKIYEQEEKEKAILQDKLLHCELKIKELEHRLEKST